ncbi:MAG: VanZ family protein [Micrococcales bacterium]|nr:VanZ family protein [Micrococcales bacterium]
MSRQLERPAPARSVAPRGLLIGALAATLVVHLIVLYWPTPGGAPGIPGFDKLVHVAVFAVPTTLGLLVTGRVPAVLTLLALHAPVSEIVQWRFLANRSGDWRDLVADLAGVLLGWVVWRRLRRC